MITLLYDFLIFTNYIVFFLYSFFNRLLFLTTIVIQVFLFIINENIKFCAENRTSLRINATESWILKSQYLKRA